MFFHKRGGGGDRPPNPLIPQIGGYGQGKFSHSFPMGYEPSINFPRCERKEPTGEHLPIRYLTNQPEFKKQSDFKNKTRLNRHYPAFLCFSSSGVVFSAPTFRIRRISRLPFPSTATVAMGTHYNLSIFPISRTHFFPPSFFFPWIFSQTSLTANTNKTRKRSLPKTSKIIYSPLS